MAFLFGWIAGCIFIFIVLNIYEEEMTLQTSKHFLSTLIHHSKYHSHLRHEYLATTMIPQQLPNFSHNDIYYSGDDHLEAREAKRMHIFLDWPQSSDLSFTVHNYKSLESILGVFPHAQIRYLLLSATKESQQYYNK